MSLDVIPKINVTAEIEDDEECLLNLTEALTDIEDLDEEQYKCKKNTKKNKLRIKLTEEEPTTDLEDFQGSDDETNSRIVKHSRPISLDDLDLETGVFEESYKVRQKSGKRNKLKTQASTTRVEHADDDKKNLPETEALTDVEAFDTDTEQNYEIPDTNLDLDLYKSGTVQISDNLQQESECLSPNSDSQESENLNNTSKNNDLLSVQSISTRGPVLTDVEVIPTDSDDEKLLKKDKKRRRRNRGKRNNPTTDVEDVELSGEEQPQKQTKQKRRIYRNQLKTQSLAFESDNESNEKLPFSVCKKVIKKQTFSLNLPQCDINFATDIEDFEGEDEPEDLKSVAEKLVDDGALEAKLNELASCYSLSDEKIGTSKRKHQYQRTYVEGDLVTDCENTDVDNYETENEYDEESTNKQFNYRIKFSPSDSNLKQKTQPVKGKLTLPLEDLNTLTDCENLDSSPDEPKKLPQAFFQEDNLTEDEEFLDDTLNITNEYPDLPLPFPTRNLIKIQENNSLVPTIEILPLPEDTEENTLDEHNNTDEESVSENDMLDVEVPFRCPTPDLPILEGGYVSMAENPQKAPNELPMPDGKVECLTDTEEMIVVKKQQKRRRAPKFKHMHEQFLSAKNRATQQVLTDTEDLYLSDNKNSTVLQSLHVTFTDGALTDTENLDFSDEENEITNSRPLSCTPQHLKELGGDTLVLKEGSGPFSTADRIFINKTSSRRINIIASPMTTDSEDMPTSADEDFASYSHGDTATPNQIHRDLDQMSTSKVYTELSRKFDREAPEEVMYLKGGGYIEQQTDLEDISAESTLGFSQDDASRVSLNFQDLSVTFGNTEWDAPEKPAESSQGPTVAAYETQQGKPTTTTHYLASNEDLTPLDKPVGQTLTGLSIDRSSVVANLKPTVDHINALIQSESRPEPYDPHTVKYYVIKKVEAEKPDLTDSGKKTKKGFFGTLKTIVGKSLDHSDSDSEQSPKKEKKEKKGKKDKKKKSEAEAKLPPVPPTRPSRKPKLPTPPEQRKEYADIPYVEASPVEEVSSQLLELPEKIEEVIKIEADIQPVSPTPEITNVKLQTNVETKLVTTDSEKPPKEKTVKPTTPKKSKIIVIEEKITKTFAPAAVEEEEFSIVIDPTKKESPKKSKETFTLNIDKSADNIERKILEKSPILPEEEIVKPVVRIEAPTRPPRTKQHIYEDIAEPDDVKQLTTNLIQNEITFSAWEDDPHNVVNKPEKIETKEKIDSQKMKRKHRIFGLFGKSSKDAEESDEDSSRKDVLEKHDKESSREKEIEEEEPKKGFLGKFGKKAKKPEKEVKESEDKKTIQPLSEEVVKNMISSKQFLHTEVIQYEDSRTPMQKEPQASPEKEQTIQKSPKVSKEKSKDKEEKHFLDLFKKSKNEDSTEPIVSTETIEKDLQDTTDFLKEEVDKYHDVRPNIKPLETIITKEETVVKMESPKQKPDEFSSTVLKTMEDTNNFLSQEIDKFHDVRPVVHEYQKSPEKSIEPKHKEKKESKGILGMFKKKSEESPERKKETGKSVLSKDAIENMKGTDAFLVQEVKEYHDVRPIVKQDISIPSEEIITKVDSTQPSQEEESTVHDIVHSFGFLKEEKDKYHDVRPVVPQSVTVKEKIQPETSNPDLHSQKQVGKHQLILSESCLLNMQETSTFLTQEVDKYHDVYPNLIKPTEQKEKPQEIKDSKGLLGFFKKSTESPEHKMKQDHGKIKQEPDILIKEEVVTLEKDVTTKATKEPKGIFKIFKKKHEEEVSQPTDVQPVDIKDTELFLNKEVNVYHDVLPLVKKPPTTEIEKNIETPVRTKEEQQAFEQSLHNTQDFLDTEVKIYHDARPIVQERKPVEEPDEEDSEKKQSKSFFGILKKEPKDNAPEAEIKASIEDQSAAEQMGITDIFVKTEVEKYHDVKPVIPVPIQIEKKLFKEETSGVSSKHSQENTGEEKIDKGTAQHVLSPETLEDLKNTDGFLKQEIEKYHDVRIIATEKSLSPTSKKHKKETKGLLGFFRKKTLDDTDETKTKKDEVKPALSDEVIRHMQDSHDFLQDEVDHYHDVRPMVRERSLSPESKKEKHKKQTKGFLGIFKRKTEDKEPDEKIEKSAAKPILSETVLTDMKDTHDFLKQEVDEHHDMRPFTRERSLSPESTKEKHKEKKGLFGLFKKKTEDDESDSKVIQPEQSLQNMQDTEVFLKEEVDKYHDVAAVVTETKADIPCDKVSKTEVSKKPSSDIILPEQTIEQMKQTDTFLKGEVDRFHDVRPVVIKDQIKIETKPKHEESFTKDDHKEVQEIKQPDAPKLSEETLLMMIGTSNFLREETAKYHDVRPVIKPSQEEKPIEEKAKSSKLFGLFGKKKSQEKEIDEKSKKEPKKDKKKAKKGKEISEQHSKPDSSIEIKPTSEAVLQDMADSKDFLQGEIDRYHDVKEKLTKTEQSVEEKETSAEKSGGFFGLFSKKTKPQETEEQRQLSEKLIQEKEDSTNFLQTEVTNYHDVKIVSHVPAEPRDQINREIIAVREVISEATIQPEPETITSTETKEDETSKSRKTTTTTKESTPHGAKIVTVTKEIISVDPNAMQSSTLDKDLIERIEKAREDAKDPARDPKEPFVRETFSIETKIIDRIIPVSSEKETCTETVTIVAEPEEQDFKTETKEFLKTEISGYEDAEKAPKLAAITQVNTPLNGAAKEISHEKEQIKDTEKSQMKPTKKERKKTKSPFRIFERKSKSKDELSPEKEEPKDTGFHDTSKIEDITTVTKEVTPKGEIVTVTTSTVTLDPSIAQDISNLDKDIETKLAELRNSFGPDEGQLSFTQEQTAPLSSTREEPKIKDDTEIFLTTEIKQYHDVKPQIQKEVVSEKDKKEKKSVFGFFGKRKSHEREMSQEHGETTGKKSDSLERKSESPKSSKKSRSREQSVEKQEKKSEGFLSFFSKHSQSSKEEQDMTQPTTTEDRKYDAGALKLLQDTTDFLTTEVVHYEDGKPQIITDLDDDSDVSKSGLFSIFNRKDKQESPRIVKKMFRKHKRDKSLEDSEKAGIFGRKVTETKDEVADIGETIDGTFKDLKTVDKPTLLQDDYKRDILEEVDSIIEEAKQEIKPKKVAFADVDTCLEGKREALKETTIKEEISQIPDLEQNAKETLKDVETAVKSELSDTEKAIKTDIQKKSKKTGGFLTKLGEKLGGKTDQAKTIVKETYEELVETPLEVKQDEDTIDLEIESKLPRDESSSFVNEILQSFDEKLETVKDEATKVNDRISKSLRETEDKAAKLKEDATSSVNEIVKETEEAAKDTAEAQHDTFLQEVDEKFSETEKLSEEIAKKSKSKILKGHDNVIDFLHKEKIHADSLKEETMKTTKVESSKITEAICEIGTEIERSITDATKTASDATKGALEAGKESAAVIYEDVKDKAKKEKEKGKGFFSKLGEKISGKAKDTDKIESALDTTKETIGDITKDVKEVGTKIDIKINESKDFVPKVKDGKEHLEERGEQIITAGKTKSGEVTEQVSNIKDKTEHEINEALKKTSKSGESFVENVEETLHDIQRSGAEQIRKSEQDLNDGFTSLTTQAERNIETNLTDFLENEKLRATDLHKEACESTEGILTKAIEEVKETGSDLKQSVTDATINAVTTVKETIDDKKREMADINKNMKETTRKETEKSKGFFSKLGDKITGKAKEADKDLEVAIDSSKEKINDAHKTGKEVSKKAASAADDKMQQYKNVVQETLENAKKSGEKTADDVATSVQDKTDKIAEKVSDIKDKMQEEAGKAVLEGEHLLQKAEKVIEDAKTSGQQQITKTTQDIESGLTTLKEESTDSSKKLGGYIASTLESTGESIENAADKSKEAGGKVLDFLGHKKAEAERLQEDAKQSIEEHTASALNEVEKKATSLEKTACDTGKEASTVVNDAVNAGKKEADVLEKDIKEKAKKGKEKSKGFFSKLGDKISGKVKDSEKEVETVMESTKESIKDANEIVKMESAKATSAIDEKVRQSKNTVQDSVEKVKQYVEETADDVTIFVEDKSDNLSKKISHIKDTTQEEANKTIHEGEHLLHEAEKVIDDTVKSSEQQIFNSKHGFETELSNLKQMATDTFKKESEDLGRKIEKTNESIEDAAVKSKEAGAKLLEFLENEKAQAECLQKDTSKNIQEESATVIKEVEEKAASIEAFLIDTAKGASDKVKDALGDGKQQVTAIGKDIKDKAKNEKEKGKGFFSKLGDKISGKVRDSEKELETAVDSTKETIKDESAKAVSALDDKFCQSKNIVQESVENGKKAGKETIDSVALSVDDKTEKLTEKLSDIKHKTEEETGKVVEVGENILNKLQKNIEDTKQSGEQTISKVTQDIETGLSSLTKDVTDNSKKLGEGMEKTFAKAGESIEDAAKKSKETGAKFIEKEKAESERLQNDVTQSIQGQTSKAVEDIRDKVHSFDKSAGDAVNTVSVKVNDSVESGKQEVVAIGKDIKDKAKKGKEKGKGFFGKLGDKISGKVKDSEKELETAVDSTKDTIKDAHETVKDEAAKAASAIDEEVRQSKNTVQDSVKNVKQFGKNVADNVATSVEEETDKIAETVSDIKDSTQKEASKAVLEGEHLLRDTGKFIDDRIKSSDQKISKLKQDIETGLNATATDTSNKVHDGFGKTLEKSKEAGANVLDFLENEKAQAERLRKDASLNIQEHTSTAIKEVEGQAASIEAIVSDAATNVSVKVKDAVEVGKQDVATIGKDIKGKAKKEKDKGKGFFSKLGDKISGKAKEADKKLDEALDVTQSTLNDVQKDMKQQAETTEAAIESKVSESKDSLQKGVDIIIITGKEKTDEALERVSEIKDKTQHAVSDTLAENKKKGNAFLDNLEKQIKDTQKSTSKTITDTATDIESEVKNLRDEVKDHSKSVDESVHESIEGARAIIHDLTTQTIDASKETRSDVVDFIHDEKARSTEFHKDTANAAKQHVKEIGTTPESTIDSAINKGIKEKDKSKGFFSKLGDKISGKGKDAENKLEGNIDIAKDNISDIQNKAEKIVTADKDNVAEVSEELSKVLDKSTKDREALVTKIGEGIYPSNTMSKSADQTLRTFTEEIVLQTGEGPLKLLKTTSITNEEPRQEQTKTTITTVETVQKINGSGRNVQEVSDSKYNDSETTANETSYHMEERISRIPKILDEVKQRTIDFLEAESIRPDGPTAQIPRTLSDYNAKGTSDTATVYISEANLDLSNLPTEHQSYVTSPTAARRAASQRTPRGDRPVVMEIRNVSKDDLSDENDYVVTEPEEVRKTKLRKPLFHVESEEDDVSERQDSVKSNILETLSEDVVDSLLSDLTKDLNEATKPIQTNVKREEKKLEKHLNESNIEVITIEQKLRDLDKALDTLEQMDDGVKTEIYKDIPKAEKKLKRVERKFEHMASEVMEKESEDAKSKRLSTPEVEERRETEFQRMVSQISVEEVSDFQREYSHLWDEQTFSKSDELDSKTPDSQADAQELPKGEIVYMGPVNLNKGNLVNRAGIEVDVIPIMKSPCASPIPTKKNRRAKSEMGFYKKDKLLAEDDTGSLPDLKRSQPRPIFSTVLQNPERFLGGSLHTSNESLASSFRSSEQRLSKSLGSAESLPKGTIVNAVVNWLERSSPFSSTDNIDRHSVTASTVDTIDTNFDEDDLLESSAIYSDDKSENIIPDIFISHGEVDDTYQNKIKAKENKLGADTTHTSSGPSTSAQAETDEVQDKDKSTKEKKVADQHQLSDEMKKLLEEMEKESKQ